MHLAKPTIKSLPRRRFLLSGAVILGGLLAADVTLRQPQALSIEKHIVPVAKIPKSKEIRLIQLSDLHLRTSRGYFERVAQVVSRLSPDAIVLTGDYLEQSRNLEGVLKFLRLLHAPAGIFAVQGNWEYWARLEGENLRRQFTRANVTLLINRRRDIQIRGVALSILGLDYPSSADQVSGLVHASSPDRFNIMLSHVPAFDHQRLDGRIDLILAGHTHGGQIRLPWLPPLYLPRFSGAFVAGFYKVGRNSTPLYVNRGLGTSALPVRCLCPPEITLFRLMAPLPTKPSPPGIPAKTSAHASTGKTPRL